jgi:hypothetical protein
MITTLSITAEESPCSNQMLTLEYLPEDKILVLSIDGYEEVKTFKIECAHTAGTLGRFLAESANDLNEYESDLDEVINKK